MSSGLLVLVDQAAQDRFSADLADAGVCGDDAGRMVRAAGDALADALVFAVLQGVQIGQFRCGLADRGFARCTCATVVVHVVSGVALGWWR